jgi:ribonuclease BN (tRNA processing enzyme)
MLYIVIIFLISIPFHLNNNPDCLFKTMDIILLGTGTAVPIRQHSPAGMVVIADGFHLLLDIGPGTLGRMAQAGLNYDQLDQLLLTHFHPDHTLDLATLLLVFNYAPGASRTRPFAITSCEGIEEFLQRFYTLYPDIVPIGYDLQINPVRHAKFSLGKLTIESAPTGHTPESVAYRLEMGERAMVYSGDAAPHGELVRLASGVDLLVCECSFPAGWETEEHLNAESLGKLAAEAGVKSLVVTHCYPPALAVDLVSQIRAHYSGEVQMALDGMRLSL